MKTGVQGMVKDRKATAFRKRKSTMQSGTERLWPSQCRENPAQFEIEKSWPSQGQGSRVIVMIRCRKTMAQSASNEGRKVSRCGETVQPARQRPVSRSAHKNWYIPTQHSCLGLLAAPTGPARPFRRHSRVASRVDSRRARQSFPAPSPEGEGTTEADGEGLRAKLFALFHKLLPMKILRLFLVVNRNTIINIHTYIYNYDNKHFNTVAFACIRALMPN